MEIQIKRAVKAGNSSAVILPRSWLNKEVRVELLKKTPEEILLDVINITKKYMGTKEIVGIYLAGSYAREEEIDDSDIDILLITKERDMEIISEGIYNILVISKKSFLGMLENQILPVGQMIRESKSLLNADYISKINVKITKKNVEWYLRTTEEKLNLINRVLEWTREKRKKTIKDRVTYTLVLRIRTLHIIKKIVQKKEYSNKEFVNLINKISGGMNAYLSYLAIKNKSKTKNTTSLSEAERLYTYLKKEFEGVSKTVNRL